MRIVVDLPAPLGPKSPKHTPTGTSRSSPSTAVIGPKRLTTPRSDIAGGAPIALSSLLGPPLLGRAPTLVPAAGGRLLLGDDHRLDGRLDTLDDVDDDH